MKKYCVALIAAICIAAAFACTAAAASSTIGSVNSYLERIDFYNRINVERTAPTDSTLAGDEHISTFNGGVSYTKKELELPGKGGHNISVTRSFNTAQNVNRDGLSKRYIITGRTKVSSSGYTTADGLKYAFKYYLNGDSSTEPLYIVYTSVYEMLEAENNMGRILLAEDYAESLTNFRHVTYFDDDIIMLRWGIGENPCGLTLDSSILMYENAEAGDLSFVRDKSVGCAEVFSESCFSYSYKTRYFRNLDSYIDCGWEYQLPLLQNAEEDFDHSTQNYNYNILSGVFYDPEWGNALDIYVYFNELKRKPTSIRTSKAILYDPLYSQPDDVYNSVKSEMYSVKFEKYDSNGVCVGNIKITRNDGKVFNFTDYGILESIEDGRGNIIRYDFDYPNKTITVTDTLNRAIVLKRDGIYVNGEKYVSYSAEALNNDIEDPNGLLEEDNCYLFSAEYKTGDTDTKTVKYDISPHSRMIVLTEKNEYNSTRQTLDTDKLLLNSVTLDTDAKIVYDYAVTTRSEQCGRTTDDRCVTSRHILQNNSASKLSEIDYAYNGNTTVTRSGGEKVTLTENYSSRGALLSSKTETADGSADATRTYTQERTREGNYQPSKIVTERKTGNNAVTVTEEYTYDAATGKPATLTRDGVLIKKFSYYDGLLSKEYTKRADDSWTLYMADITSHRVASESYYTTTDADNEDDRRIDIRAVTYQYNAFGDLIKEENGSVVTQYSYSYSDYSADDLPQFSMTISKTVPDDDYIDGDGVLQNGSVTSSVSYDVFGNPVSSTDAKGNITTVAYDKFHRPLATTYPNGTSETIAYDDSANTVVLTAVSGKNDLLVFDSLGRSTELKTRASASGSYITVYTKEYDNDGRITEYEVYEGNAPLSKILYSYYDDGSIKSERVVSSSTGALLSQKDYRFGEITADGNSQNTAVIKAAEGETLTVAELSDAYGRKIMETMTDSETSKAFKICYKTDIEGNITSATNRISASDGNPNYLFEYTYDAKGRVLTEYNSKGTLKKGYTGVSLSWETDRDGNEVSYSYNKSGKLKKEHYAKLDTYYYYDANGNLAQKKTGNIITDYRYDNMNRLSAEITHPTASTSEVTRYSYDNAGNLIMKITGLTSLTEEYNPSVHSARTYTYDAFGNCTSETSALQKTQSTAYNTLGYPTSVTRADGSIVSFAYDEMMRKTQISCGTESVSYAYDLLGNVVSMTDGGGTTSYVYNAFGQKLSETRGGTSLGYSYDSDGNLSAIASAAPGYSETHYYGYDELNRLTRVTWGTNKDFYATYKYNRNDTVDRMTIFQDGRVEERYTYDKMNRMLTLRRNIQDAKSVTTSTAYDQNGNVSDYEYADYAYDGAGRIISETYSPRGTITYAYDSRGNRISMQTDSSVTTYTYDLDNKLLSSAETVNGSTAVTTYTYDQNGSLTQKQTPEKTYTYAYNPLGTLASVTDSTGSAAYYTYDGNNIRQSKRIVSGESDATTQYINDGGNVIAEITGEKTQTYIRGKRLIAMQDEDGAWSIFGNNYRGDVERVQRGSYSNGRYNNRYAYDAFGNYSEETDSPKKNPFRYCGEYTDDETGLIYLRNRYYDPAIGRFITEDPAKDGLNWYAYCGNNPIRYVDPWGLIGYDRLTNKITDDDIQAAFNELSSDTVAISNGEIYIAEQVKSGEKPYGTELVKTIVDLDDYRFYFIDNDTVLDIDGQPKSNVKSGVYNDKICINVDDLSRTNETFKVGVGFVKSATPMKIVMAHEMIHVYGAKNGFLSQKYGPTVQHLYYTSEKTKVEVIDKKEAATVGFPGNTCFNPSMTYGSLDRRSMCNDLFYTNEVQRMNENLIRDEQGIPRRLYYRGY